MGKPLEEYQYRNGNYKKMETLEPKSKISEIKKIQLDKLHWAVQEKRSMDSNL